MAIMQIQVQVLGWLIAGSTASWLAYETWGRGPLGMVADWLVGLTGAMLGVPFGPLILWLASLVFALVHKEAVEPLHWWTRVEGLDWWVSTPLAFAGALLLIRFFRVLARVRPTS